MIKLFLHFIHSSIHLIPTKPTYTSIHPSTPYLESFSQRELLVEKGSLAPGRLLYIHITVYALLLHSTTRTLYILHVSLLVLGSCAHLTFVSNIAIATPLSMFSLALCI